MSSSRKWARRARAAAIVLATGAAVVFTNVITLPTVLPAAARPYAADLALGSSAQARAARAQSSLAYGLLPENAGSRREWVEDAIVYSRLALAQEPGNIEAARTLALAYEALGQPVLTDPLLRYAHGLSRRDWQTELALGQRAQEAGRPDRAMAHYGHALAGSGELDAVLAQLAGTETDRAMLEAVGHSLAKNPPWKSRFLGTYAARTRSAASLYRVSAQTWRHGLPAADRKLAGAVLGRLTELQAADEAKQLYGLLVPGASKAVLVKGGGFDPTDDLPPFTWRYAGSGRFTASPEADRAHAGTALRLHARSATRGTVASQTLVLAPGPYRLAFSAEGVARELAARPALRATCLRSGSKRSVAPLVEVQAVPAASSHAGDFTVPQGCPFQLIEVRFGAPATMTEATSWIDDVAIMRR